METYTLFMTSVRQYRYQWWRTSAFPACLLGLAGMMVLAGCGSSSGTSTSSTAGRATVFLTDSPREIYAHVWVTVYHVELVSGDGSANVVVFDDPSGRQIDLKTLRDASGERYTFLSSTSVPAGTYTGASVTIGTTVEVIKTGATTGDTLTVDTSIPLDVSGHPVVTATFKKPKALGSISTDSGNIVVDFDLAHFIITDTHILPTLGEGSGIGLKDASRHDKDEYHGTVSDLTGTAPTLTFTLTRRKGQTVTVTTTASTTLYGDATLANGAIVDVTGIYDPTAKTITATQVTTRDAKTTPTEESAGNCTPRLTGSASDLDATAGTLTVTIDRAHGFTVDQTAVKVVLGTSADIRDDSGKVITAADFFTALATTPTVSVEGTYDTASNTLTATHIRIVDATQDGGWASEPHSPRGKDKKDKSDAITASSWSNGTLQ